VAAPPARRESYHRGPDDEQRAKPMTIVERNANRLVVEAGGGLSSFSLALDKNEGLARIERSTLMWKRRPRQLPLGDIKAVDVASLKDRASGAEMHKVVLLTQDDEAIEVPVEETAVEETAETLRDFLGLAV
jgi:hypothetical protein